AGEVLLRWGGDTCLRGHRARGRLEAAESLVAAAHERRSRACKIGRFALGRRVAISIRSADLPPRRSHSLSASRASSYPTSPRNRKASAIDRSAEYSPIVRVVPGIGIRSR